MERLGFGNRIWMALTLPWRVLFNGAFAARVHSVDVPALPPPAEIAVEEPERDLSPALQLLAVLQREGRLVDFLYDEIAGAADADIGAAARVVHEGCRRALKDYVEIVPIRSEEEGATVELDAGFDAARNRVTGNVSGDPPYQGTLAHHGWVVSKISLPTLAAEHDPHIVVPAEVEL